MKKLFNETWKPIKGYEGLYEVSNLGNLRSLDRHVMNGNQYRLLKGKPKKPSPDSDGYLITNLSKNGQVKTYFVHRLVAEAFIPNPNVLPFIDHINTVKDDNKVENLRWCTHNKNRPKEVHEKMLATRRKNQSYHCEIPVYYIDEQGKKISFKSISEAARKIGCPQPALSKALKKNRPIYGIQFHFGTEIATAN